MGQVKGSLMKGSKSCVWKQCKNIDLISTSHQQMMSIHFMGSWTPVDRTAASEENAFVRNVILLLSLNFYCWGWHHTVQDMPLVSRISCPVGIPSQTLVHSQSLRMWVLLRHFRGCCGEGSAHPCQYSALIHAVLHCHLRNICAVN